MLDITGEVMSFVFEDNENRLDTLEITVANRDLRLTDHPLLQEGNSVWCRWGYGLDMTPPRDMVIRETECVFPEGDVPTIKLTAYDLAVTLGTVARQRVWRGEGGALIAYHEIAERIAAENGLTPVVAQGGPRHQEVAQANETDLTLLVRLAKELNFACYVQDRDLHFHPRELAESPTHRFVYRLDGSGLLKSFTPKSQGMLTGRMSTIKSVGVDPREKQVATAEASNATEGDRVSLGDRVRVSGSDGLTIIPSMGRAEGMRNHDADDKARVKAEFEGAEMRQVEASAETIGLPDLRAKTNIEIGGVGNKFNGVYRVEMVRHKIDQSGYGCELTLRRNALGRGAGDKTEQTTGVTNEGGQDAA